MPRKKKVSEPLIKEGDIVILWSLMNCEGQMIGSGTVERVKPMHGNPEQDMIWVPGFSAHHPNAVERVGSPAELIGKIRALENELESKDGDNTALKQELLKIKDRHDGLLKAIDKTTSMLTVVDGSELLDAKAIIKWIRDVRNKFSLSLIREIGQTKSSSSVSPDQEG